jgi:two-component system response regulator MtrA
MDERVLVVEDDASIRELAEMALSRAGFRVTSVGDGDSGLRTALASRFDVVVLDVMLPGRDGFEVCRELRRSSSVPIVMLSARSDTVDVVVGLESGADDYVTKPFETAVLVARVRAVLRRASGASHERVVAIAGLELDAAGYVARRRDEILELTATEFRLLLELARRPGQVFTRELLLELVWSYDYLGDSRMVDVAVGRLRAKIEDDPSKPRLIRTVRGVGYRFARPDEIA